MGKKNKPSTVSFADKENLRSQGAKNIDLWVDGRMYPKHPLENSTPPFEDVTSLIGFVRNGEHGLLGYTKHLETASHVNRLERDLLEKQNAELKECVHQREQKIKMQLETIALLKKQRDEARMKQTTLGLRKRQYKLRNIQDLKVGCGGIKKRVQAVK